MRKLKFLNKCSVQEKILLFLNNLYFHLKLLKTKKYIYIED